MNVKKKDTDVGCLILFFIWIISIVSVFLVSKIGTPNTEKNEQKTKSQYLKDTTGYPEEIEEEYIENRPQTGELNFK